MTGASDAVPALLPIGLGDLGGKFNQIYTDTFERIILEGRTSAGCWTSRPWRFRA